PRPMRLALGRGVLRSEIRSASHAVNGQFFGGTSSGPAGSGYGSAGLRESRKVDVDGVSRPSARKRTDRQTSSWGRRNERHRKNAMVSGQEIAFFEVAVAHDYDGLCAARRCGRGRFFQSGWFLAGKAI